MPETILRVIRKSLRRRQLWRKLGWSLPKPLGIRSAALRQQYDEVLVNGQVVWAAIAQANSDLFQPGTTNLPANIVFSPSSYFDGQPWHLSSIAHRTFELKSADVSQIREVGQLAIALTIRDEFNAAQNMLLPPSLTDGHEVYFSSLEFLRKDLPEGHIAAGIFPLVYSRQVPVQRLLPKVFWSPQLIARWSDGFVQEPEEFADETGGRIPPPEQLAFPKQQSWDEIVKTQQDRTQRPQEGIALTGAAAGALLAAVKRDGEVLAKLEEIDGSRRFSVVESWNPSTEIRIDSHGVGLIVNRCDWERIEGTLIDIRNTGSKQGFVFQKF